MQGMQRHSSWMYRRCRHQMTIVIQRIKRYLLLGILSVVVCFAIMGCDYFPESTFTLAGDSRLPKWFPVPPGLARNDISVTMIYYAFPLEGRAKFIWRDASKHLLKQAEGKVECNKPFVLRNSPEALATGHPAYEAITVDGVTEIIEHRKMEPLFSITDDSTVWKQYQAIGCG